MRIILLPSTNAKHTSTRHCVCVRSPGPPPNGSTANARAAEHFSPEAACGKKEKNPAAVPQIRNLSHQRGNYVLI